MKDTIGAYHSAVQFLEGLKNIPQPFGFNMERKSTHPEIHLKRMIYFLSLLEHPERGMRYVHVTGTAGKGSVAHLIHRMLSEDGRRVGLFTSPFVTTTAEKIITNSKFISTSAFTRLVDMMKPSLTYAYHACQYGGPTYFEALFALALLYFREQKCGWVVLEVGCGGRFDATNVIPSPAVAIVTNIDYDHMAILGNTLKAIAHEKAGIIKRGSICIIGESRAPLRGILERACWKVGARYLYIARGRTDIISHNYALAAQAARECDVQERVIHRAAHAVRLPARFEIMQNRPLVILDGAHNRIKMKSTVERLCTFRRAQVHLIIGFSYDKDYKSMLQMLLQYVKYVYATRFGTVIKKCVNPKDIIAYVNNHAPAHIHSTMYLDSRAALTSAMSVARPQDTILITGSFYLAGELRAHWFSEADILRARFAFPW